MPGVYELADENKVVIYIGQSASDVPGRLRQHLSRPGPLRDTARFWRYEYSRVPQADEAKLLAAYREAHGGALPPCNTATPLERDAGRRFAERFRASGD
ncbi:MAG: GIY-YIG nuclease family protein [Trueperaceae bacterium]|nr:GIY-YIG nuclease family protein [Trueperaceae bacterium]